MIVDGMQSTFGRKPQIKGVPDNIDYYDEIILGTPIWAGMPAAPVYTFIKKYGIADKIDAVFTFSGGGDNDRCMAQLSKTLKNIKNEVALADRNSEMAKNNHDKLEKFIMDIKQNIGALMYKMNIMKTDEKKLLVTFCAVKSNVLLGWLIGLGNVEELEPEDVKEKMIALLDKNKDSYKQI